MTKDDFLFLVETETIHDFIYKAELIRLLMTKVQTAANGLSLAILQIRHDMIQ